MRLRSRGLALMLCASCADESMMWQEPDDAGELASNDLAYDPLAGYLPALILDAQVAQQAGKLLSHDLQRQLFDYGRAHTEDPRPWILLARDSMARDWAGFAMSQYGLALRADARVTRAPGVLSDVLQTAIDYTGVEESDANALLIEYWGLAALPALDRELERMQAQGRDAAASKLVAMRKALIAAAD